jgi:hypothetical protein
MIHLLTHFHQEIGMSCWRWEKWMGRKNFKLSGSLGFVYAHFSSTDNRIGNHFGAISRGYLCHPFFHCFLSCKVVRDIVVDRLARWNKTSQRYL